jgi:hypothetical protein
MGQFSTQISVILIPINFQSENRTENWVELGPHLRTAQHSLKPSKIYLSMDAWGVMFPMDKAYKTFHDKHYHA